MGSFFATLFNPRSPVEENHRVVQMKSDGSNVDREASNELLVKSMLEWCQQSQDSSQCLLQRQFIDVRRDDAIGSWNQENVFPFRIMQWNVLADALGSGKDNFIKCPPEAMSWNTRKLHLLEEMLTYAPDIICCQEVDHFDDFFQKHLKKVGYKGAFLPKPWSPCLDVQPNNGPDGCAIFFRSDKFKLLDFKAVTLKTMTFWTNHVALFHLLQFKKAALNEKEQMPSTGKLLIGTTHLKAKVGYENLRAKQGKDLLSYLAPYAKENIPIIVCGDFNATPDEEVYRLICNSEEPFLESAYSCLGEHCPAGDSTRRREPPYTTWCIRPHGETPKTVDYMWYSRTDFRVNRLLEIPTAEEITVNRLPSSIYPSDHMSLVCDMELISQGAATQGSSPVAPKI